MSQNEFLFNLAGGVWNRVQFDFKEINQVAISSLSKCVN